MKKNLFSILSFILLIALVIVAVSFILKGNEEDPVYSDIVELFENIGVNGEESVKTFKLEASNKLTVITTKDKKIVYHLQDRQRFYDDCYDYVLAYNAKVDEQNQGVAEGNKIEKLKYDLVEPTKIPVWVSVLPYIAIILLLAGLVFWVFKQSANGKNAPGRSGPSFAKSRAKMNVPDEKKRILFSDVAGADEEKEELQEIVHFLKDPDYFTRLGAKIPHGVLLVGPPGTGKTLLAKAVAGEAGVPFYSISGSDFVEMYVGVGASRVRDLFETARKHPASIIFIDEIDAVGRHRGAGLGGGHDEREQTLNQLLVEMDGFSGNDGIIVMAATNRPDILDPALLRPGRFDREITVNYPDLKGREEILKIHARNKPFEEGVDLSIVAKGTAGFTGADLANLLNEAALLAARRGKALIGMNDIEDAIMKIVVGTQKKSMKIKDEEKRKTAYHEAGHALIAYYLPSLDPVHQISIIPSGRALGYTLNLPQEDKYSEYRSELSEHISMLLGGRVAEKITFNDFSGGASNDIQRATEIARKMVTRLGMSDELGPIVYGSGHSEVFLGKDFGGEKNYSESTAALIDSEIKRIITEAYDRAEQILTEHSDKLKFVAEFLVKYETMDEIQFKTAMEGDHTFEEIQEIMDEKRRKSMAENEEKRLRDEEEKKRREEEERLAREREAASEAASGDVTGPAVEASAPIGTEAEKEPTEPTEANGEDKEPTENADQTEEDTNSPDTDNK
ncbi:MAG: ATP-dependent zinc metalloprotease FtsH [Clostridia bacterium]|nr:ATP-dependent zinc metalloprotease FtsH [Clostridia bacterium]